MAVLAFDGSNDRLTASTLSVALRDLANGAYTIAFLVKRRSANTWDALGYLRDATPTALVGLSIRNTDELFCDIGIGSPAAGSFTVTSTTITHILVASRPAGTNQDIALSKYDKSATAWTHDAAAGSTVSDDGTDATVLELGMLNVSSDPGHIYMGLIGIWNRELTQGQKEELDNNWRTSDWWAVTGGAPICLVELTSTSPTDLASGASNWSTQGSGLTTTAETLDSWNFDGIGAVVLPPKPVIARHAVQRAASY